MGTTFHYGPQKASDNSSLDQFKKQTYGRTVGGGKLAVSSDPLFAEVMSR